MLDRLPRDVLLLGISPYLEKHDLLRVRATDRYLNDVFTGDELWSAICARRWFQYGDDEVAVPKGRRNWFQYYTSRAHVDFQLLHALENLDSAKLIELIDSNGDDLVPALLQILATDRPGNLAKIYRASVVLKYLSFSKIYDLFEKRDAIAADHDYESVLVTLNRIDPKFYIYNRRRLQIRRSVISEYQSLIFTGKHIDKLKYNRTTDSVVLITEILRRKIGLYRGPYDGLNEMVFAIYNGKAEDFSFTALAIISGICQDLGLDVKLTKSFGLRIADPNFPAGYCYAYFHKWRLLVLEDEGAEVPTQQQFASNGVEDRSVIGCSAVVAKVMNSLHAMHSAKAMSMNRKPPSLEMDIRFLQSVYTNVELYHAKGTDRNAFNKHPPSRWNLGWNIGTAEGFQTMKSLYYHRYALHFWRLNRIFSSGEEDIIGRDLIEKSAAFETGTYDREHHFLQLELTDIVAGDIVFSPRTCKKGVVEYLIYRPHPNSPDFVYAYMISAEDGEEEVVNTMEVARLQGEEYEDAALLLTKFDRLGSFIQSYDPDAKRFVLVKEYVNKFDCIV